MVYIDRILVVLICTSGVYSVNVTISGGKISGSDHDYYVAFEGIPYAEAPIGNNRFEPPKPYLERWKGTREYTKLGPKCLQWDHLKHDEDKLDGNEDCLTINVYVPKSVINSGKSAPVIFFIHGGAFMFGGAYFYEPQELMKKDLVLVTINYRLGPLGFLSTEDGVIPGNMGLKDQVEALKWVNENIENFLGDKDSITTVGFSAGGASVHLFYMSPLTKGLFKNGISHSGTALNPWVIAENSAAKTHKLANHLSCPTDCHKKMLECLKKQPAENIVRTVELFLPFLYNPFSPFGVVVEPADVAHAFLTDFPSRLLQNHKIHKLPWIASATQAEGLYPCSEFLSKEEYMIELDKNWENLAPFVLDFNETLANRAEKNDLSKKIRHYYMQNQTTISKENFNELTMVYISHNTHLLYITNSPYFCR